jgi:hypothetical protein
LRHDREVDLDSVTGELYGLAPGEFTAARDVRAGEARAVDRALAERIRKLHRPSLSAWALNVFARERGSDVDQLLELGEQLRLAQVTLAGDELRQLLAQRRQLVRALTSEVRRLAHERGGQALSERATSEVSQTLEAALADSAAAATLRSGRLVTALSHIGLGADVVGAAAPPRAPTPVAAPEGNSAGEELRARRLAAERELGEAAADLRRARDVVVAAGRRASVAVERHEQAIRHAETLAAGLDAARGRAADAEGERHAAEDALACAEQVEAAASARAERAEGSLAELPARQDRH